MGQLGCGGGGAEREAGYVHGRIIAGCCSDGVGVNGGIGPWFERGGWCCKGGSGKSEE